MAISKSGDESAGFPAILSDEEFDALRERREQVVRSEFDSTDTTDLPPPSTSSDSRPESTIEQRFAHVAKMLVAMWPSEAIALYIQRIVVADRETRAGFPADVIEDMLMLDAINDMLLRKGASRQAGPMQTATDRGIRRP